MKNSNYPTIKSLIIISFVIIIIIPTITKFLDYDPYGSINEKRQGISLSIKISNIKDINMIPKNIEAYYNDNFGFRKSIIHLNNIIKMKIGVSPTSKVIIGKSGWLYYSGGTILNDYIGILHYDDIQKKKYFEMLKNRAEWLKSKGIRYLFVIAPNAQSVYPEYVPGWLVKCNSKTKLDSLLDYFHEKDQIDYIDLRSAILSAKKKSTYDVYYHTDTHWNDIGAFHAYSAIIDKLINLKLTNIVRMKYHDYDISNKSTSTGDLAQMIGTGIIPSETVPYMNLKREKGYHLVDLDAFYLVKINKYGDIKITENRNKKLLKAVIFRDSFTDGLFQYLSESFSRVVYCWFSEYSFEKEIIEREKPDIVLSILVERFLDDTIKYPGDDVLVG